MFIAIFALGSTAYAGKKDFAEGKGTKDRPYLVSSYKELTKVADHNGCYFKQTKDIDCDYNKISSLFGSDFYGEYDGDGYTIRNVQVQKDKASLISSVDKKGVIENLTFEDVTISGKYRASLIGTNDGTIRKVTLKNSEIKTELQEDETSNAAALCFKNGKSGTLSSCKVVNTTVSCNANSWLGAAKGAGLCITNSGVIKKCKLTGLTLTVNSVQNEAKAAGLVLVNKNIIKSCSVKLKETATCYGDKKGAYGAAEYGTMARLVYSNSGSVISSSSEGTFKADRKVKDVKNNSGIVK